MKSLRVVDFGPRHVLNIVHPSDGHVFDHPQVIICPQAGPRVDRPHHVQHGADGADITEEEAIMATQTLVRPAPTAAREQRLPSIRVTSVPVPMAPRTTTFRVAEVRVRTAAPAERRVGEPAALRSPRSTPTRSARPVEVRPVEPRPVEVRRVEVRRVEVRPTAVRHPARSGPAAFRLTRRGRLALACTLAVLALLGLALLQARMPAVAGTQGEGPATRTVVVEPGQTLWQIAREIRPHADPRETVARIQELNGLTTVTVWAGQPLIVPA